MPWWGSLEAKYVFQKLSLQGNQNMSAETLWSAGSGMIPLVNHSNAVHGCVLTRTLFIGLDMPVLSTLTGRGYKGVQGSIRCYLQAADLCKCDVYIFEHLPEYPIRLKLPECVT